MSDRKRAKLQKLQLREQFNSLPEPEYSYEVTLPEVEEEEEGETKENENYTQQYDIFNVTPCCAI